MHLSPLKEDTGHTKQSHGYYTQGPQSVFICHHPIVHALVFVKQQANAPAEIVKNYFWFMWSFFVVGLFGFCYLSYFQSSISLVLAPVITFTVFLCEGKLHTGLRLHFILTFNNNEQCVKICNQKVNIPALCTNNSSDIYPERQRS